MPHERHRYSLRELVSGRAFRATTAARAVARPDPTIPLLRPPGALPEADFLAACTKCGACLPACPHGSIRMAPDRFRRAAGTPILDAAAAPCWMCPDTPCIAACAPGALRRTGDAFPRMGVARILTMDCLAHQGSTCTTCFERCPAEGALVIETGRPRIVPERCTGCGVCLHVCPAPRKAVLLTPLPRAPERPRDG